MVLVHLTFILNLILTAEEKYSLYNANIVAFDHSKDIDACDNENHVTNDRNSL